MKCGASKILIRVFVLFTIAGIAAWLAVFGQIRSPRRFPKGGLPESLEGLESLESSPKASLDSEFTFVRMMYTGLFRFGYYKAWNTDWPKADRQFLLGVKRLTNIRVAERERVIRSTDKQIFDYPFIYAVEVGHWNLTDEEGVALREYLLRGGMLFCDDFWGSREWANFQRNIEKVLPGRSIIDIPMNHPLFHSYYDIQQIVQTPNMGSAISHGPTYEEDGYVPHCRGILDDNNRLMVVINWNTDLGDAWEWADFSDYPTKYSTYAYQMGINAIIYAMSH